jgi:hypothetical protein
VSSWTKLKSLQAHENFPIGFMLSANIRAWTEAEVETWLASRPTLGPPLKGAAKLRAGNPRRKAESAQSAELDCFPATTPHLTFEETFVFCNSVQITIQGWGNRMKAQNGTAGRKRTAVLVVHGMGSQRPLETVRGVVEAVWLEGDHSATGKQRMWTHPERSGVDDIDLPVITTNFVPNTDHRRIDFHELYWAHLMSETRAVAVLLWLFELARMGPRLKPSIAAVYWRALVFLALLVLSVSLLAIQISAQLAQLVALHTANPYLNIYRDFHSLVYVFLVSIAATASFAFLAAVKCALKLALYCLGLAAVATLLFVAVFWNEAVVEL